METIYIYGGYILTGGTIEDKDGNTRAWYGVNILLAQKPTRKGQTLPMYGTVVKASRSGDNSDELMRVIQSLVIGQPVHAYFSLPDANGKVKCTAIKAVQSK